MSEVDSVGDLPGTTSHHGTNGLHESLSDERPAERGVHYGWLPWRRRTSLATCRGWTKQPRGRPTDRWAAGAHESLSRLGAEHSGTALAPIWSGFWP